MKLKKSNPKFRRQNAANKSRLGKKWRRPKGLQSKLRLQKAGLIHEGEYFLDGVGHWLNVAAPPPNFFRIQYL